MAEKQIFIVGTGRTGSTVLRRILGHHSRIYTFSSELRFLSDNDGLVDLLSHLSERWSPFNASLAIHRFRRLLLDHLWNRNLYNRAQSSLFVRGLGGSPHRYNSVNLGKVIPRQHCRRVLDDFTSSIATIEEGVWYGSPSYQRNPQLYVTTPKSLPELYGLAGRFMDNLLSYPLKETEQTCWCDDTPINVLNGGAIARMFDQPRIIHLYRDPRDVIASYADKNQKWAPDDPVMSAKWVLAITREWWRQRKEIPKHLYCEIKYEDIVREQKNNMKSLVDFLGVRYEHNSLMSTKLNSSSIGRFKKDIHKKNHNTVESIVSPILEEYDYK